LPSARNFPLQLHLLLEVAHSPLDEAAM